MCPTENTVYEALRPIQISTKVFGFSARTDPRAPGNKTSFHWIHVFFVVLVKVLLIYYNWNPSKFKNVTNSGILNIGLWIQTEATLIISIGYIIRGISRSNITWGLIHKFHAIDQDFTKFFFIKYYYVLARHWVSLFVISGFVIQVTLLIITTYFIWDLPFEFWHKLSILVAIHVSNSCIWAIVNQYVCAQLYISSRFQNINDILSQLILDESSIDDGIQQTDYYTSIDDAKFAMPMSQSMQKKRAFGEDTKSDITFVDNTDCNNAIQIIYPFEKEFPRAITDSRGATSRSKPCKKIKFPTFSRAAYRTSITKLAFTRSSSIADISNKLDKLMELHDRLCDCVDDCNYLLAVQVLLITLTICVYIVFGLFAKYRIWMDYQHEAANVAQMNICWIVVYTIFIALGTYVSSGLMQTIQESAIIIHKIACRYDNTELLIKLSRISQMLHSRKTTVGCGLIVFDWSTIFTLFGSVCMYLIILIQFYISAHAN